MPFNKGWNRWSLPQDMLDKGTMKLTMVYNSWSLPMFKELFFVGKLADMDFNDAMSRKNMAALHETIIDKALFLYIMVGCAPQLRVVVARRRRLGRRLGEARPADSPPRR